VYGDVGLSFVPEPPSGPDSRRIQTADDKWTDDYALNIVKSDFAYAEYYRTHAHDWRYRNASELYLAWAAQRYWEGTRVPRSSLGIYTVFEQVESMLPKIVSSICDPEAYNFYPMLSNQNDHAQAWRRLVVNQLNDSKYREHIRRMAKSSLIYGNGLVEFGWEDHEEEYVNFSKSRKAGRYLMAPHPLAGMIPIPMDVQDSYSRKLSKETHGRPYVKYTSVIDSYIDPNCESTNVQDAGYHILRVYKRAEEIKAWRGKPGFNIPDDETLLNYSMAKTTANQDVTKLSAELFRYNLWNPALDYSADPAQKRIEVVKYTTKDRIVICLNREHIAFNRRNRYGCINYLSMTYADVLDRWHGLAVSDVAEGEQRLQQSITNARLDELALAIHTPMIKRRGVTVPPWQLKRRPGQVIETESPESDIKEMPVSNITQNAMLEVDASERRVQKITGMTDLISSGTAAPGGNSALRSATGVNTSVGATQDRIKYYIENAEDNVIEPLLNQFILMDKKWLDMKRAAAWLRSDPEYQKLDPVEVFNCIVMAESRGAAKMAARMGFLQVFPLVGQTYLNPEFLQLMAQQQKKTINMEEFGRMLQDAINYQPRNPLIIDMPQAMIQAMQQPPPADKLNAQVQMQDIQSTARSKEQQYMTKLIAEFVKQAFQHHGKMEELDQADQHKLLDAAQAQQEPQAEGENEAA